MASSSVLRSAKDIHAGGLRMYRQMRRTLARKTKQAGEGVVGAHKWRHVRTAPWGLIGTTARLGLEWASRIRKGRRGVGKWATTAGERWDRAEKQIGKVQRFGRNIQRHWGLLGAGIRVAEKIRELNGGPKASPNANKQTGARQGWVTRRRNARKVKLTAKP